MKIEDCNPLLGAPARLVILATLADDRAWSFSGLKKETGLADGNLHVQTRKLVEAGWVWSEKLADGGRRMTSYRLTPAGRAALQDHWRLIGQALAQGIGVKDPAAGERKPRQGKGDGSRVW